MEEGEIHIIEIVLENEATHCNIFYTPAGVNPRPGWKTKSYDTDYPKNIIVVDAINNYFTWPAGRNNTIAI